VTAVDELVRVVLRLRRDAQLSGTGEQASESTRIVGPFCALVYSDLPRSIRGALEGLAAGDHVFEVMAAEVMASDGIAAMLRLKKVIGRLDSEGLLEHAVCTADTELARLRPVGRGVTDVRARAAGVPVRLSRFAVVHAENGRLVAERPGSHLRVELTAAAAAGLFTAIAGWNDPASVALSTGLPVRQVAEVLALLGAADLLADGDPDNDPELSSQAMAQWSPADRWLHAISRGPRVAAGYGGTYRDAHRFVPTAASPAPRAARRVALYRPDLAALRRSDPSLTDVLERRQSIREHDDANPITVDQLGELLFRAARQRQVFTGTDGQELADRPYPAGGAVHELEIYPLVTRCAGIEAGLWHYRAADHELELVSAPTPATAALVSSARDGGVMNADPQIALLISARFDRVMWKYESVAYALILKHVGVFYHHIYLIGTAMNLAVCGLGGGDAAEFAAATGFDGYAESTVGELVIGTAPAVRAHRYELPRTPEGAPS